jgi:hypothetical protein
MPPGGPRSRARLPNIFEVLCSLQTPKRHQGASVIANGATNLD